MKRWTLPALLPLLLFAATVSVAEEKFDPAARAKAVAPFIDEETVVVSRIDFTRIRVDPLVDAIASLIPGFYGNQSTDAIKGFGNKQMEAFRKAGVVEGYSILAPTDFSSMFFGLMVIPLRPGADEAAIKAAFPAAVAAIRSKDCLAIGDREFVNRVSKIIPHPRPELTAAFEAAGDAAVQVVFTPPKHFRRVVEEIMPQLPKEIGGGDSKILTQGCLWAAIGIDMPPQISVKLVIQSQDAAAADALRAKWIDAAKLIAQMPRAKAFVPNLMEVADALTPDVEESRLVLSLDDREGKIGKLIATAQPAIDMARDNALRMQSMNNLKMIGLAMLNYQDANKHFPAAAIYSKDGKPLLSWRVMVLPYLECKTLYNQFHLDEPWDSPHNIKLLDGGMPDEFRSPRARIRKPGRTNYVVPVGPGTVFEGKEGMKIKDIKDGLSHTIMAVEVDDDHAVIWTKPDDLNHDPKEPAKGLGGHFKSQGPDKNGRYLDVFLFLSSDGAVGAFPISYPVENLRAWFSASAGDAATMP